MRDPALQSHQISFPKAFSLAPVARNVERPALFELAVDSHLFVRCELRDDVD